MNLKRKSHLSTVLVLLGGIAVNTWGLTIMPLDKLPISPFWHSIVGRALSSLLTFACISFFCPNALRRFFVVENLKRVLISILIVTILVGPTVTQINFHGVTFAEVTESFVFALFIGIEEDFFSRGFVFGVLEKYGVWVATLASSALFGISHLTNIAWGHQSAAYTLAQAVSAGAFGFLASSLMIYSGTIWIPILMHGLCDFPMQFETASQYTQNVTGGADWVSAIGDLVIYSVVACILIILSDPLKMEKAISWGQKFGLVNEARK